MSFRKWITKSADKNKIYSLSRECEIPLLSAAIFCARSIENPEEIKKFVCKDLEYSCSEHWYGMDLCVRAINKFVAENKKICIYGDYDADGVTATALMYEYLKYRGADVIYYIPERDRDGYGLNNAAIDYLHSKGVRAIITVDNGVSAAKEIDYANSLGIKVVVTDHHKIPPKLPRAEAIVDPHIPSGGEVGAINFAGVGVAFEVIKALEKDNKDFDFEKYIDLVAIGTIGDSIELAGSTRKIVRRGIAAIENKQRIGIKALSSFVNFNGKSLDAMDIAFSLVPKINACGRLNSAETAIKLLLSDDIEEASDLCKQMIEFNDLRREIEEQIIFEAEKTLKEHPEYLFRKVIVLCGQNWHHGVLGIVASRITEKYGKPCVMITIEGDKATGSCRSPEGFSIYNLVASCSGFLERFGGHHKAAGFNLKASNVENFMELMIKNSENVEVPHGKLVLDLCVEPAKVSTSILDAIDVLKPFGNGNPEPVFGIMNVNLASVKTIGGGRHLKLFFEKNGFIFDVLYFNKTEREFLYYPGERLDLAVKFLPNNYGGILTLSRIVIDMRLSGYDFGNAIAQKEIYEKYMLAKKLTAEECKYFNISRDDVARVYKYFKNAPSFNFRADIVSERVFQNSENIVKIYVITDILRELDLIHVALNGDEYQITLNQECKKVDLNDSEIFRLINSKMGDSGDGEDK